MSRFYLWRGMAGVEGKNMPVRAKISLRPDKMEGMRRKGADVRTSFFSLLMISGIGVADLKDDARDFVVREAGIQVKTHESTGTREERMP